MTHDTSEEWPEVPSVVTIDLYDAPAGYAFAGASWHQEPIPEIEEAISRLFAVWNQARKKSR